MSLLQFFVHEIARLCHHIRLASHVDTIDRLCAFGADGKAVDVVCDGPQQSIPRQNECCHQNSLARLTASCERANRCRCPERGGGIDAAYLGTLFHDDPSPKKPMPDTTYDMTREPPSAAPTRNPRSTKAAAPTATRTLVRRPAVRCRH